MSHVIRVRDVVRSIVHERGPDEPILRGPYDLSHPVARVMRRGALVEWLQAGVIRSGRAAPALLGSTHPGERVLLQLPPHSPEDEWWLCEVESIDGVSAAL